MGRPRSSNKHLPKYVTIIHGSYWYRPSGANSVNVCRVGDEVALYTFMAKRAAPTGPVKTMNDLFNRYENEVIPTLTSTGVQP